MNDKPLRPTRRRLAELLKKTCFKQGRFILASGKESNYYFDARVGSLSAEIAFCIASLILEKIQNDRIDAVGGLTLGADPIVGALVALSYQQGMPLNGFIVRKQEKKHGTQKCIEGPALDEHSRVVIIDDVVTTGASTVQAIDAARACGAQIVRVIAVVDRNEGAREAIAACGMQLESLFSIDEFLSPSKERL